MWIVIMGNIGAGKTTLARMLANYFLWGVKYEAVDDNPYLEDFYKDMNRYSFESQIYFMNRKLKDILDIKNDDRAWIQDRTVFEDRYMFCPNLYEQGHLDKRAFDNYCDLYDSVEKLIGKPDLLIYIKSSIGNLTTQIAKRGRAMEANMSISYLQGLNEKYNAFADTYTGNMIVIDGDTVKFEDRPQDFDIVVDLIQENIKKAAN